MQGFYIANRNYGLGRYLVFGYLDPEGFVRPPVDSGRSVPWAPIANQDFGAHAKCPARRQHVSRPREDPQLPDVTVVPLWRG